MKKKIVFLIVMLVLVVGAYTGYKYLYKDHRNITKEVAILETSAAQLQAQFQNDLAVGILNKTIQVSGVVTEIEGKTLTIDEKVHVSFTKEPTALQLGNTVHIKGRCIGYDDLFDLVKIDQAILTK